MTQPFAIDGCNRNGHACQTYPPACAAYERQFGKEELRTIVVTVDPLAAPQDMFELASSQR